MFVRSRRLLVKAADNEQFEVLFVPLRQNVWQKKFRGSEF